MNRETARDAGGSSTPEEERNLLIRSSRKTYRGGRNKVAAKVVARSERKDDERFVRSKIKVERRRVERKYIYI